MRDNPNHCRKSIWLRIVDYLMILITMVAVLAMISVLIGQGVSPNDWWPAAFVILAAPFVFLANIVVLIYWILRWRIAFILILGAFALVWVWQIGAFVQMRFFTNLKEEKSTLKILSYNIHNFRNYSKKGSSVADALEFIRNENPDIVCFQDYAIHDSLSVNTLLASLSDLPYYASIRGGESLSGDLDCLVFSRHPISPGIALRTPDATGGAVMVDVYIAQDTIRLYNCHLQTTSFNSVNPTGSLGNMISDERAPLLVRTTARALRDNFKIRSAQADSIAMDIESSPHPVMVVGDFNSVPLSYTYTTIKGELSDAFRSCGQGYGYTYRPMLSLLRIDYLFYDDNHYQCLDYRSPDEPYSDHNPVIVTLKKR